jgi:cytochrome oxidase Cu insertion factor (SCO1/SenC/PrrC family)
MNRDTSTSRPSYRFIIAMMVALSAIAVIAIFTWRSMTPTPDVTFGTVTTVKTPAKVAVGGPFSLTGHHGNPVSDTDFRGQFMLISFGYTFCPDVCPTTLQTISAAMDSLGADSASLQPIFITVDPERDTVDSLSTYVDSFHPKLVGLTGAKTKTDKVAGLFRVYHKKVKGESGDDYTIDHSAFIYLMGPDGKFLTMFRHNASPDALAQDIRVFLKGPKNG